MPEMDTPRSADAFEKELDDIRKLVSAPRHAVAVAKKLFDPLASALAAREIHINTLTKAERVQFLRHLIHYCHVRQGDAVPLHASTIADAIKDDFQKIIAGGRRVSFLALVEAHRMRTGQKIAEMETEKQSGITPFSRAFWRSEDGRYGAVRLETKEDFMRESRILRHCVGTDEDYFERFRKGEIEIWSFRNVDNKPLMTIEYDNVDDSVEQMHGKDDRDLRPNDIFLPQLLSFLFEKKVLDVDDAPFETNCLFSPRVLASKELRRNVLSALAQYAKVDPTHALKEVLKFFNPKTGLNHHGLSWGDFDTEEGNVILSILQYGQAAPNGWEVYDFLRMSLPRIADVPEEIIDAFFSDVTHSPGSISNILENSIISEKMQTRLVRASFPLITTYTEESTDRDYYLGLKLTEMLWCPPAHINYVLPIVRKMSQMKEFSGIITYLHENIPAIHDPIHALRVLSSGIITDKRTRRILLGVILHGKIHAAPVWVLKRVRDLAPDERMQVLTQVFLDCNPKTARYMLLSLGNSLDDEEKRWFLGIIYEKGKARDAYMLLRECANSDVPLEIEKLTDVVCRDAKGMQWARAFACELTTFQKTGVLSSSDFEDSFEKISQAVIQNGGLDDIESLLSSFRYKDFTGSLFKVVKEHFITLFIEFVHKSDVSNLAYYGGVFDTAFDLDEKSGVDVSSVFKKIAAEEILSRASREEILLEFFETPNPVWHEGYHRQTMYFALVSFFDYVIWKLLLHDMLQGNIENVVLFLDRCPPYFEYGRDKVLESLEKYPKLKGEVAKRYRNNDESL